MKRSLRWRLLALALLAASHAGAFWLGGSLGRIAFARALPSGVHVRFADATAAPERLGPFAHLAPGALGLEGVRLVAVVCSGDGCAAISRVGPCGAGIEANLAIARSLSARTVGLAESETIRMSQRFGRDELIVLVGRLEGSLDQAWAAVSSYPIRDGMGPRPCPDPPR